jgi:hypothetical protein
MARSILLTPFVTPVSAPGIHGATDPSRRATDVKSSVATHPS